MDDNGATTADDQGSGWFEVKKDSKEHEKDEGCLDKRAVGDDNGRPKTSPLKIITTTSSQTSTGNENLGEKKPDVVHKIKWGDLEDNVCAPDCKIASVSEIRFGEIGDEDLAMCGTSRNLCDLSSCNIAKDYPVVNKDNVEVTYAASDACNSAASFAINVPLEEHFTEVDKVASTDVEMVSETSKVIDEECSHLEYWESVYDNVENLNECEPSDDAFQSSSTEEAAKSADVSATMHSPDECDLGPSAGKDAEGTLNGMIIEKDMMEITSSLSTIPGTSGIGNSEFIPAGSGSSQPNSSATDNLLNEPVTSNIRELEQGERRERFRERLWSFLFENLNRAIDELYLLFELECDVGQGKEAILVLQEAESDFRELNTKVEEFETTKKNSCLSTSDAVMSMKGNHRRPHALSWESVLNRYS